MNEEEARDLERHLNREFRGYGYMIECEQTCNGNWMVRIT